jgi:Ca2+/Na+ antiporter
MFKAKLIESEIYYKLRNKQILLTLLSALSIGLIVNFYQIPIWITILMFVLYFLVIVLIFRNQKQIKSVLRNKLIEIDENEIRIKSTKGIQEEIINLSEVSKIILKNEYSLPQDTMKEIGKEIVGNIKRNYLILKINNLDRKLYFEVDSYYMINQLNKIIEIWKIKGFNMEKINSK